MASMASAGKTYMGIGAAYGVMRKLHAVVTGDLRVNEPSSYNAVPMMATQKASVLVAGTAVSALYWPLYVIKDSTRIELSLRGIDLAAYGYERPVGLIDNILD